MLDKAAYMRIYRARRLAAGRPLPRGAKTKPRVIRLPDPQDFGHPESDVRCAP